jgi:hypothetical protein
VTIVPAANMSGSVGDQIESVHAPHGEKHFVSPKKTASDRLPSPYVVLEAQGVTEEEFERLFEWDFGNGEVDLAHPNKFRVFRESEPARNIVQVRVKEDGRVVDKMNVWIVWADVSARIGAFPEAGDYVPGAIRHAISREPDEHWRFVFDLKPKEMFGLNGCTEFPRLDTERETDVPGKNLKHLLDLNKSADTALMKWDVTRQLRVRFINPWSLTQQVLGQGFYPPHWWFGQPKLDSYIQNFPQGPQWDVTGNDDPLFEGGVDESDVPYSPEEPTYGLEHDAGQLTSYDVPRIFFYNAWGGLGVTLGQEYDFREFARLELWDGSRAGGQTWFRVSDFYEWHHYFRVMWQYNVVEPQKSYWSATHCSSAPGISPPIANP